MSRPLRLEHPGALWHVASRGNERQEIFRDHYDREWFLDMLGEVVKIFRWRLYSYALMGNHHHLLAETPEPNLSRGMQQINGRYAQEFNRRYGRCGHLFQGRFTGVLVEKESHLLELTRYIVLNPVRADLVATAAEWPWSSYRATAGLIPAPEWLDIDAVLVNFHPTDRAEAQRLYRDFVAEAKGCPHTQRLKTTNQIYLGSEEFLEKIRSLVGAEVRSCEFPEPQRRPARPTMSEILELAAEEFDTTAEEILLRSRSPARKAVAILAKELGAFRLREIGVALGTGYWGVSKLIQAAERVAALDCEFREKVGRLTARLQEY